MSATDVADQTTSGSTAVRPFQIAFPQADIADLSAPLPHTGRFDLLTTILHELGHLLGFTSNNPAFMAHVTNGQFIAGPLNADVKHNLKAFATYQFKNGLSVGAGSRP